MYSVHRHTILGVKIVWGGVEDAMPVMTRITLPEVVCIKRMQVVKYDQEVVGVDKGVRALFLGKVESGRNKNNFEIVVEVVNNKHNNSRVKMKINTWADVTKVGKNQLPLFGVLIADVKQSKKCLIRPDKHDFECYGHFEEINRK